MQFSKEYRLSIGIMLINDKNEIFIGNRSMTKKSSYTMPQGGIMSAYETPYTAMCRELYEEIGIKLSSKCYFIARSKYWYKYDFPQGFKYMIKYKGQMQKWFLLKFVGNNSDIKLDITKPQEFHSYIWAKDIMDYIIPVKQRLYKKIYSEFDKYIN